MSPVIFFSTVCMCTYLVARTTTLYAVTWNDLRRAAAGHILPLKHADESIERSEAAQDEAKAGFFPTIKATASSARTVDPEPAGSVTGTRLGVTASQNLFSGLYDQKNIDKFAAQKQAAIAARAAESVNQRSLLRKIFNNGLYQQQLLELYKKIVARREQNVRIVNLRYNSGLENKSSYLKVQAAQLEAEANRDLAVARYTSTKNEASRRSGRNIAEDELFEGSLLPDLTIKTSSGPHPTIVRAQADRNAAAAQVDVTRSGWFPQLTADASAFRSGRDFKLEPQNHYELGITLTVPIFSPSQSPRYREAASDLAMAEMNLATTQLDYDLALNTAKIVVEDARRRVDVAAKSVEATEMQAEVYRKRYTMGLISFQDWDAAETDFIKANTDYLVVQQKFADAAVDLDSADGRKLEDEGL